ncbi:MAG: DUF2285 domain-containing protein [Betaproteobacteria bacterium]|nr:DUF2285 domain-containing protein [Betaproteobacteria bacterium]
MRRSDLYEWHPHAGYLYALLLGAPALAWEYLRRNPEYRQDWRRQGASAAAGRWGLRLFEDPELDARDACPIWTPDLECVLRLCPDTDSEDVAAPFRLWNLPGRKQIVFDGHTLSVFVRQPGCNARLALAASLADGMPFAYVVRPGQLLHNRTLMLGGELKKIERSTSHAIAATIPRPTASALLEMQTLQALDGHLAGASAHEIADVLFGSALANHWHADSGMRSKVRRLVRRGSQLMRGGYRQLLYGSTRQQGRPGSRAKRPSAGRLTSTILPPPVGDCSAGDSDRWRQTQCDIPFRGNP